MIKTVQSLLKTKHNLSKKLDKVIGEIRHKIPLTSKNVKNVYLAFELNTK